MKTTKKLFAALIMMLFLFNVTPIIAQDDAPDGPMYLTATTMYWAKDYEGTMDDWKAAEKEYMEKVTQKNEYISHAAYHTHLFTENSNEIIYVQGYTSWENIEKAGARNSELEKEAWPDEEAREAFLEKMNSAYSSYHSDEIMVSMKGAKHMSEKPTKDMVVYLRKNKWAFPKDGTMDEYGAIYKKIQEDVINKNDYIKAYYPNRHNWGSDRRDFIEAIFIDSIHDLGKMFDRNQELMKEALTEEESEALNKYFKGHADYLYTWHHELSK